MNRSVLTIVLLVILTLITACAPEVAEFDVDSIGELLLTDSDLPLGYIGGRIEDRTDSHHKAGLNEALIVYLPIEAEGLQAGFVTVYIYDTEADAERGYEAENTAFLRADEEPRLESTFGTIARSYFGPRSCDCYQNVYETVFKRCRSVIHIRITPAHLYDEALGATYAQRLDERISDLVCPEN